MTVARPSESPSAGHPALLPVAIAGPMVLAAFACLAVQSLTTPVLVSVPPLAVLGGRSDTSLKVGEVIRDYGNPAHEADYRQIARERGLGVEFVEIPSTDEVFKHGLAGWPLGQVPPAGARVPRGTIVRLRVIIDEAVPTSESVAVASWFPRR